MRLVDIQSKRLVRDPLDDYGHAVPYAILSHRWLLDDDDEVSFHDMASLELAEKKKGYAKFASFCQQAETDGLRYVWMDTCCIDKSSSAELSEAINSMYRWYQEAKVCYVYLKDLGISSSEDGFELAFRQDEWFTRGWTLQELLAPPHLEFFNLAWTPVGNKTSLRTLISVATGIDIALLRGESTLQDYSIAERMSWAAKRTTKRIEDRAYSLFGIFNVNLPMLYGEGSRAFFRLQEEILKYDSDHSIFAWSGVTSPSGLLAPAPEYFAGCRGVKSIRAREGQKPFVLTNRGVAITLRISPWTLDTYVARILCKQDHKTLNILLRRMEEDDQYVRVNVDGEDIFREPASNHSLPAIRPLGMLEKQPSELWARDRDVNVRQVSLPQKIDHMFRDVYGFRICKNLLRRDEKGNRLFQILGATWVDKERIVMVPNGKITYGTIAVLDITKLKSKLTHIKLGFDFNFHPTVMLAEDRALHTKTSYHPSDGRQFQGGDVQISKGFWDVSSNDTSGWNRLIVDKSGKRLAAMNYARPGLWTLKGDRIDGLDLGLGDDNGHVRLIRSVTDMGMIWDFDVELVDKRGKPLK